MLLNAESLRKVLELECNKGYADSAVMGGLDKFLHRWAGQAAESITSPGLLRRFKRLHLAESNYTSLTREQRKEWITDLLGCLSEIEEEGKKKDNGVFISKRKSGSAKELKKVK